MDIGPAISSGSMRRSRSRKTTCMRTDFCRSRCGSCCIRERRRRSRALEKKVLETVDHARRGAPASSRSAPRQASRRQRLGRIFEGDDARAGVAALARRAAHRAPRERHQGVPSCGVALPQCRRPRIACARSSWCTRVSSRHRPRNPCSRSLRAIASSATRVRCSTEMIRSGELRKDIVDGVSYVSPAADSDERRSAAIRCDSLRRSTRSCGTARGSSTSGDGRTGSRRTPR